MSELPNRPKPGEDEEEIFRQMRNFEASKSSISSANIKSFQKKKPSKFAQQRAAEKVTEKNEEADKSSVVLKSVITERQFNYDQFSAQFHENTGAFPDVMKLSQVSGSEKSEGKSLFAKQLNLSKSEAKSNLNSEIVSPQFHRDYQSRFLSESKIFTQKDKDEIHEANVAILNSKSEEQLKADREQLLSTMKPEMVEFLMHRKKALKRPHKKISPEPAKKLIFESEKMKWMEDVETPPEKPQNFNARFDFDGNLLPYTDETIAPNSGLHHHGEEPHRPGYTLEELMTLSRSSNAQQSSIALKTLANIIKNERQGRFLGCFDNLSLVNELLEADLVTILRVSMDNHHSDAVLDSAVQALAEILYFELEENTFDFQFFQSSYHGYLSPSLYSKLAEDKDFKEEEQELKDIQVLKADLVLGLLRTNIIERICYLFSCQKPLNSLTIASMLKILIRFSRHSLSVASQLANHEKLLPLIFEHFLPLNYFGNGKNPIHFALKFVRSLMAWGRNLTKLMLAKFDLGPRILCYLSIEPNNFELVQESLRLIVEAARTWIICLKYGLATDLFMEFHPVLMRHLIYFNSNLSLSHDEKSSKFNFHFAVAILEIINSAVDCAPKSDEIYALEDKKAVQHLDWSALTGILETIETSLKKWSVETNRLEKLAPFCLDLMTSILSLYANFIKSAGNSGFFEQVNFLKQLQTIFDFVIPNLIESKPFSVSFIRF